MVCLTAAAQPVVVLDRTVSAHPDPFVLTLAVCLLAAGAGGSGTAAAGKELL